MRCHRIAMDDDPKQDDLREDALRFGDYKVLRDGGGVAVRLGSGGYGLTYKARNPDLGNDVASKVIRPELAADASAQRMFLQEAQVLDALTDENIQRLRHCGRSGNGQRYYVMDYCGGGTLAERVEKDGPRPPGEALEIVRQVASALVAVHAAGFIHRDIKPGNIMLVQAPPPLRVKVIDFGLALGLEEAKKRVKFEGTSQWASPEQLLEDPLDERSDLFSLGKVLWYLLEGTVSDSGKTIEVATRPTISSHPTHDEITASVIRECLAGYADRLPQTLPDGIRELLVCLLETDPAKRPASAAKLVEYIDNLRPTYPYAPAKPGALRYVGEPVPWHKDLAGQWSWVELAGGQGMRIIIKPHKPLVGNPGLWENMRANLERLTGQQLAGQPRFAGISGEGGAHTVFDGVNGDALDSLLKEASSASDRRSTSSPWWPWRLTRLTPASCRDSA